MALVMLSQCRQTGQLPKAEGWCRGKPNREVPLPQLLRAVQPDMKALVMLRDPVERMYSAFWYYGCLYNVYKDYGMNPKGFHKLVVVWPSDAAAATI